MRRQRVVGADFGGVRKKLGGNADVFENTRVAKKGICKSMKMRGMQIDGVEGAIRKLLKRRDW